MNIHDLLINWARWVRLRPHQGHCASIEFRYKLRRRDDTKFGWGEWNTTPPPQPLPPVDNFAALEVERVMRFLPDTHRVALKLHYVWRETRKNCCRCVHVNYNDWETLLHDAQQMVLNILTMRNSKRKLAPKFVEDSKVETWRLMGAGGV